MEEKQRQQIRQSLDVFLRRKKIIFSFLLLAIVAGVAVYLAYPKTYESTALIMYQRQKVSPSEMSPDYKTEFMEIITNLSQQITSRTSLEDLINRFRLYPELRKEKLVEDIVSTMRKSIQVVPEREGDVFRVTYEGSDPQQVMRVTSALAAKFIEENLRFREEWTSDNLAYIRNELKMAKKTLDEKESVMRDYKLQYYNEMSEQRQANMTRMAALQTQHQHLQNSIQELERTKVLIQEQITFRRNMLTMAAGARSQDDLLAADKGLLGLAGARQQLAALQGRYTERHPDVVRLKALVMELEKSAGGPAAGGATAQDQSGEFGPQARDIEMNIRDLRAEMARVREQMEVYQGWIEMAPVREAEWASLTRDYNEFRKHYEELVSRSLQAESAETLEKQQKGSQFRILDPANLPDKPSSPNFLLFMLVAAMAGLGLGGGLSFLLETMDNSFKDAADLESCLGVPVTCSIPLLHTEAERQQLKMKSHLWAAAFGAAVLIITSGIVTLWYKQIIII
jgi:polysaccharide biosynthesis transport protein